MERLVVGSSKRKAKLERLVASAKYYVLRYLRAENRAVQRQLLEPYVLSCINIKEKRDGTIKHDTQLIHGIAFIKAYKELEREGEIKIERGDVPFPMTDFETAFSLKNKEVII